MSDLAREQAERLIAALRRAASLYPVDPESTRPAALPVEQSSQRGDSAAR